MDTGVIYCDDNRHRLSLLPRESVDLIYLDPPFFSNRHYEVIWGDEAEVRSFEDRWEGGIYHYVEWMKDRVIEMKRVLKPTGTIYLHCDPHASHYLKVMLDEVFGEECFRNEIVWAYKYGGRPREDFGRKHDVILRYVHSRNWFFDEAAVRVAHEPASLEANFRYVDAQGRRYRTGVWKSGKEYRYYADEGRTRDDVWTDLGSLHQADKERLGYPTQKPERLLEVIVQASSREGDIVLDPFAGCGTALVVAHRLKRQWVGIDISPTACNLMRRRLQKVGALDIHMVGMPTTLNDLRALKPFEFQNWIVDRINGIQANRKTGDMGIDGWTFFLHDPVQIKQSDGIGRNVIDNFETAVQRDGKKRGFVIAFSFGRGSIEEASRVRREGLDIHLVTVSELLTALDEVLIRMGITSAAGALPGLEAAPMPTIDSGRRSAEELIASAKAGAVPSALMAAEMPEQSYGGDVVQQPRSSN